MISPSNQSKIDNQYDVSILGGGLAGLTLALHCRKEVPNAKIAIIEKKTHPVSEATHKVGESSVEIGAHYFSNVLGLEQHILENQLPKLGLRFFFGNGDNSQIEKRLELGGKRYAPTPSFQLDRGRFENFLAERCQSQNIDFLDGSQIKEVKINGGRVNHEVRLIRDKEEHTISTRWVADASGRAAILKRKLGLDKEATHKANATWFRINKEIRVDDWSDDPKWQEGHDGKTARWYSTNHLMGDGYWVWLIPLASGSTSIGIVADENIHPLNTFNSLEKSLAWLDKHEPQCAAAVREDESKIQDFLAIKRYSRECKQVFSQNRWGIVGEAGFFLDPFYSPGSDFIAFGNTFLSNLIKRDLSGKWNHYHAFLFDKIYKKFHRGTSHCYQDQYPIFGNQQIMPIKIMWDYMVYWTLSCYVFFHGRTCNTLMYPRHLLKLNKLGGMNMFMQELFRNTNEKKPGKDISGQINISTMPIIWDTNKALKDDLSNREYSKRFGENVAQVETLFWEIIDHLGYEGDVPYKRKKHTGVRENVFEHLFDVVSQEPENIEDEVLETASV